MTCVTDYSVITNSDIIIKDTSEVVSPPDLEVVVEHFIQPDKPENLDVLFVIDTSCSMTDNFENVSKHNLSISFGYGPPRVNKPPSGKTDLSIGFLRKSIANP